jgi:pyruvate,orthophosphate dikinase
MNGYPVTIRTLDPPLHEFLPKREELMVEVATLQATGGFAGPAARGRNAAAPGGGAPRVQPDARPSGLPPRHHLPEITAMQVRAILEAACLVKKEGVTVIPEIMIPLVGTVAELAHQKAVVVTEATRR